MKVRVSSKGLIPLPAELRKQDQIRPRAQVEIERVQPGQYLLKRLPRPGNSGLLDCPDADWFRPVPFESNEL